MGLGMAASTGAIIGGLANGILVERFGQKRTIWCSLWVLAVFVFIVFFAPTIEVLCIGELLCGLPWGVFATSAPAYATEVLPISLKPYLTSYTNMCFVIGQVISGAVLLRCLEIEGELAFRLPFALQWAWPVLLIPILWFAPESPWHLVRKNRIDEAKNSLDRLRSKNTEITTDQALHYIAYTNQLEESFKVGTSYRACFKGTELRRTEIACIVFAGQVASGQGFAYKYVLQKHILPFGGVWLGVVCTVKLSHDHLQCMLTLQSL
jgi:SP family general alpha glucoside:H+ symporter-like MFS transporter